MKQQVWYGSPSSGPTWPLPNQDPIAIKKYETEIEARIDQAEMGGFSDVDHIVLTIKTPFTMIRLDGNADPAILQKVIDQLGDWLSIIEQRKAFDRLRE